MAEPNKDTIYIDIDDEITGVIDKLHGSKGKVVALVLPKRAAVFQSIVNMKLLKRAADDAKKHLVLVTNEAGLLPLAGAAGVHVAKTLNSKPEIPSAPQLDDGAEEAVEETGELDDEPEVTAATAGDEPVGKLAGLGAAGAAADGVETLELDDDEPPEASPASAAKPAAAKAKKNKKLKIPDFNRFRLLLIVGGGLLVLFIIFLILAFTVLPKATINIATDATNVNASVNLTLSTAATSLDASTNTVPAKLVQDQKTYTGSANATGQKNEGNKASGTVSLSTEECAPNLGQQPASVPAGSGVSANNLTYITQQDASFTFSHFKGGSCAEYSAQAVPIIAQAAGANYNTGNANFSGPGGVGGSGSASGGTDNIVQVVSQADITTAKNKITTSDATEKQGLQTNLKQAGYFAIASTYSTGTPTVTSSSNAGDTASSVTVTEVVTYTMFGAHESDLKTLIDNNVKTQIDTAKQSILSEGLDSASFGVTASNGTSAQLTLQAVATAGPQLDTDALKKSVAGRKPGDVTSELETNPDVTGVKVKLSPFWVSSVPKKTSKITINIAKPTTTAKH